MRKIILSTLMLCLAILSVQTASAQVKFGLKGGVNVTHMSLSTDVLDKSNNAGFYVGPTVYFNVPIVGLGFDASVLYDQRSADVQVENDATTTTSATLKQKQIAIPINVRYGVGLGNTASIFLYAGPQFGFNVAGDVKKTAGDWKWKDSNFSVNIGAGVMLLNHLQVNANYNVQCGKTGEATWANTASKAFTGKEHAWQIGLAYYF
jgi:hypothetical protein